MSYHIYTTDGIILKRTPFGEANILLHVLTEEFGLIMTSARSARLSVSKLRPSLQEYEYVSLSCIKGKNGWKVTNVVGKQNFFFDHKPHAQKIVSQIAVFLMKMMPGESPQKEIFQTVRSGFESIKNLDEKEVSGLEMLLVLRILHQLGYVVKDTRTLVFLEDMSTWNSSELQKIIENKKEILELINGALKESHL